MAISLIRRVPSYDLFADDNRDPMWMEFVAHVTDEDEVWECRFGNDAANVLDEGPQGMVILRDGVEIASFPPDPSRRLMN